MVGGDVVDVVGGGLGGVDLYRRHGDAVDEGLDAEVEVGLRCCDRRAEVLVAVPHLDDGGVVAASRLGSVEAGRI